jgi:hypothetical protein
VSAHLAQPNSEFFVGTLNGVMYRIRPGALATGGTMFSLEPIDAPAPSPARAMEPIDLRSAAVLRGRAQAQAQAPVAAPSAPGDAAAEAIGEPVPDTGIAEREAAAAKLFKREGAEPLRAGHPDLWALLVRGTSLEGTTFQEASAS